MTVNWEWIASKPRLAPESFETCEPTIYLSDICQELIDEFESKKKKQEFNHGPVLNLNSMQLAEKNKKIRTQTQV